MEMIMMRFSRTCCCRRQKQLDGDWERAKILRKVFRGEKREILEMIVEVALKEFSFEFGVFMELVGIVVELEKGVLYAAVASGLWVV
jgi:hypothetical protein